MQEALPVLDQQHVIFIPDDLSSISARCFALAKLRMLGVTDRDIVFKLAHVFAVSSVVVLRENWSIAAS
jgi:hypothetical protein